MKKRYQRLGVMGLAAVMACTGTVLPVLARPGICGCR